MNDDFEVAILGDLHPVRGQIAALGKRQRMRFARAAADENGLDAVA